jgi:hypothetical protein
VGPEDGECTCIRDMQTRHHVEDYATIIVTEMTEALGVGCEEMFAFGVEEVRSILTKCDRQSAGLLNVIIQEYKARENPNARH